MKRVVSHLTFQVLVAIVIGVLVGMNFPAFAPTAKLISQTFINMISMLIAPIIFFTIVLGIAQMGDMKKVGRVGGKALLYFELITTLAIIIGLLVANIFKPGKGVDVAATHADPSKIQTYQESASGMNWLEFFAHIVPKNIFVSFAKGDILQILFFAVLFGFALSRMGSTGSSLIVTFEKLSQVIFNIMKMIMKLAPFGAFGGMAFTIGTYGLSTLYPLGKLMIAVYMTMALFIFVVLNLICYLYKFSLWQFLKFIRQEIVIVLGTSSSESVLPSMMLKLEKFGCSKSVVGLVVPTGYSFNLDGTSIYLSMSVIFLSQVFNIDLSIGQQITIIGVLMVTSKGAAGVTGSGFIVLASTLTALKVVPIESIAILLGVDRFMSEARAITNLIGNGVASVVIAKSEKEFDQDAYKRAINPKTADDVIKSSYE
ncbi:MAG: glutamate/aspartate:proton symporter GltP [Sphingobacteriales bacterium 17-39-43]|uniref:C4-dicarboxylate transporter DctA n=1 Tax=Daejeonella sp. TaxID=2805397 RepID=UPI000BCDB4E5|nr:C4-dicarboxylate transporter DctA [Daejeonella sp.]OYY05713.1 MAG: glutamate/aspartate:proton symporter GltP [Sphingobacteriia bacterium 35-40-5]OYZ31394.1 MAG: glutamate/aspartate:proton symporter GltP [Sphingobacteriales bacterium 16-39-50]OYZ58663.1 MAG: glutamate/aspartate:proton symporter GltP [Sphingobacteriales bacterium 24-40-4]OZA24268.1 MAG: glutamate/aspartate:proton symporter GltP [Sphingobacteriales bacterium 17-39-43]HQS04563.1 C4-dicarboxylate transporter DctA [Daejeonella sp